MLFETSKIEYVAENQNTILDYKVEVLNGIKSETSSYIIHDILIIFLFFFFELKPRIFVTMLV